MPNSRMNRTTFFVDGFNLYHSLLEATRDLGGQPTKWLDINGQQTTRDDHPASIIHRVPPSPGDPRGTGQIQEEGRPLFDLQHHEAPFRGKGNRRRDLRQALGSPPQRRCRYRGSCYRRYRPRAGGQDGQETIPEQGICFAFPYKRRNSELEKLVSKHFHIRKERYIQHRLPDPFTSIIPHSIRRQEALLAKRNTGLSPRCRNGPRREESVFARLSCGILERSVSRARQSLAVGIVEALFSHSSHIKDAQGSCDKCASATSSSGLLAFGDRLDQGHGLFREMVDASAPAPGSPAVSSVTGYSPMRRDGASAPRPPTRRGQHRESVPAARPRRAPAGSPPPPAAPPPPPRPPR